MRAFSLIELVLAFSIAAILMVALALGIRALPIAISDARDEHTAIIRMRALLDDMHAVRSLSSIPAGTVTGGRFTSLFTVLPRDDDAFATVRAAVGWKSAFGSQRRAAADVLLLDASSSPEACDPFTSGDWTFPVKERTYSLRAGDLLPAAVPPGAYSIAALAAAPGTLAIAIASTTQATDPSLLFFATSGTSTLSYVSGFDNASSSRIGFSALALGDGLVFASNSFASASDAVCGDGISCAQAQVFRFLAAQAPARVSALTLATSAPPYARTVQGIAASAITIAYGNHLLFLGLEKTQHGDEFNIVDAHDPQNLRWLSGFPVGRSVTGITVRNGLAYLSTDDPLRELILLDISDPAAPHMLGIWNAQGPSTFGYGGGTTLRGNLIRFGRTYTATGPEFELLDSTNPHAIREIAHSDPGTVVDRESVTSLLTQDRNTFVLMTRRLEIWDTHRDTGMTLLSKYALPYGAKGVALACRNDQLYVAYVAADGSSAIDLIGTDTHAWIHPD